MLEKTIKNVLSLKVARWKESITDENVIKAIDKDLIITGGCITSLINSESPNDYDCYMRTKESALILANYYVNLWNSEHENQENKIGKSCKCFVLDCDNPISEVLEYFKVKNAEDSKAVLLSNLTPGRIKVFIPSDGVAGEVKEDTNIDLVGLLDDMTEIKVQKENPKTYKPVFMSSNAISLTDDIQLVVRFYGEPSEIHDTFDFVHTKAYFDYANRKVVIPSEVYEAVINKTLIYTGSKYPVCSLFRLRKFISRGWKINAGQILKMAFQVSELDLQDVTVLEDQLIGVDTAYFVNMINRMKADISNGVKIDQGYLISLIDKVF